MRYFIDLPNDITLDDITAASVVEVLGRIGRQRQPLLEFRYQRDDFYQYVIAPQMIHTHNGVWCVSGDLITRDGDPRPNMGPTRRRTFQLDRIESPATIPSNEVTSRGGRLV